ncbi:MAG: hypothetical protein OJF49_002535 [Ktedonobacterales bacterium]|jgi:hypothetical protein|nr:MAG: hypothetical protein OJF49_002535 [Ktedonobacterales bacterium]
MATIIHANAIVQPDGTIAVNVPDLTPGQRVTVTIETQEAAPAHKPHALDLLANMPGQRLFKTAEEVDAYIREERDSWDR